MYIYEVISIWVERWKGQRFPAYCCFSIILKFYIPSYPFDISLSEKLTQCSASYYVSPYENVVRRRVDRPVRGGDRDFGDGEEEEVSRQRRPDRGVPESARAAPRPRTKVGDASQDARQ